MEEYIIWISIGIVCLIIEIFTPGFLFMSFGVGAILTGLFSMLCFGTPWNIAVFIVVTFLGFLFLRKWSKMIMKNETPTNVEALLGKKGIVTKKIERDGRGFVKIGGEIWSAVSEQNNEIPADSRIKIIKVDGNKLIVNITEE